MYGTGSSYGSGSAGYGIGGYSGSSSGYGLGSASGGNASYAIGGAYKGSSPSKFYDSLNSQLSIPAGPHESIVDNYLEENRPATPIVTDLGDVQSVVDETFRKMTGQEFPRDMIHITILPADEFARTQPMWSTRCADAGSICTFSPATMPRRWPRSRRLLISRIGGAA